MIVEWVDGFEIKVVAEKGEIVISANREGLLSLAKQLTALAERNAMFNMITNGENDIRRVLAIMPDGKTGAPCGICRSNSLKTH